MTVVTDLVLGMRLDSELVEIIGTPIQLDWFRALTPEQAWNRLYRPMHAALIAKLAAERADAEPS